MKRIILAFAALAVLAGCNTMAGIGEDTQALGQTVEKSAENHHHYRP